MVEVARRNLPEDGKTLLCIKIEMSQALPGPLPKKGTEHDHMLDKFGNQIPAS